jgi:hypothetical protein
VHDLHIECVRLTHSLVNVSTVFHHDTIDIAIANIGYEPGIRRAYHMTANEVIHTSTAIRVCKYRSSGFDSAQDL